MEPYCPSTYWSAGEAAGRRTLSEERSWPTSSWLGIVIGFAIHVSGVVYAFASLVVPALIAKNLGRTARSLFFLPTCISLDTGVTAFVLANHYDFPPGQAAAVWLLRAARPR